MSQMGFPLDRRSLLAGLALLPLAGAAGAQGLGSGLTGVLGKASDSALDKLAVPGAFYADPAVRIMLPLLGFYSAVVAIIGGAFISSFALDIPFFTFLQRTQEVVPITDVWVGLVKAPVFALIVALAGCYQGMQVTSNSEEVGARTTQAVVTAIFTVMVLDAFFAVFFTEIGWK